MTPPHPSDSGAQREAESDMLRQLSEALDLRTPLSNATWTLPNGSRMEFDGSGSDGTHSYLVEVYARIGALRGAQLKKVATDVLKLSLAQRHPQPGSDPLKPMLLFASDEALGSVRGWLREAIDQLGIEVRVIRPSEDVARKVVDAQSIQVMVNAADVTDAESE